MRMCLNRNVLLGLAVVAGGVLLVAPQAFLAALPLLILLACPLSMIFMMRGMTAGHQASASRPHDSTTAAPSEDQTAEVARLRAEIDQLRAGLQDGRRTS